MDAPDLYDQAFVLFALASCFVSLGRPTEVLEEAHLLLDRLTALLGHPERGFEEARPRTLPLRSNPHMHLLEALLAWCELGVGEPFVTHAKALIDLAIERLIDPATGAVGEYYDGEWRFHSVNGRLREPGHQFEWAYLLFQAGKILGEEYPEVVHRLHSFGNKYGIRESRVIFSVSSEGQLVDGSARLWAQTERLRTMLLLAPDMTPTQRMSADVAANDAVVVLRRMLQTPIAGLWYDRMDDNGRVLDEAAPASSLYHIVTGISPLIASDGPFGFVKVRSSTQNPVGSAS
jgi:mannose-6-phosphate isomerase